MAAAASAGILRLPLAATERAPAATYDMASTAGSQHRCVFVGNIPYDATEEQLIQICEEVGPVVSFRLVLDKESGKPKGYGFCEYKDEETALSARRNLQGYEINGRQLRVDFAENDKGADRNREQGRGGPGLTSGTDGRKSLPGHPFVGDAALHQPLGLPLAATAASVMAEALGGSQTGSLPQFRSVPSTVFGSGNDPLTLYLAKMSRYQLNEIILEMKGLATKNKALAQQLLRESPQLPKALFQAQIMLGIMTPQMMQAASNQKTSSAIGESSVQDIQQDPKPLLPFNLGLVPSHKEAIVESFLRPPEAQANNVLPSSVTFQQPSLPPRHAPFQAHQPPLPQNQIPVQGIAGITMHSNIQVPSLPTSRGSLSQVQPSLMHHSRPLGATSIGQQPQMTPQNANLQQSLLPRPFTSQFASSNHPVVLSGLEMLSKEAKLSGSNLDSTWASRISTQANSNVGLVKHNEVGREAMALTNHLSKRPKLEEGDIAHNLTRGSSSAASFPLVQLSDSGLLAGRNSDGLQRTEKQITQLSPEEESALLQQLMSLTPEQLSSLPLEQQQQVLEIQRSLRLKIA